MSPGSRMIWVNLSDPVQTHFYSHVEVVPLVSINVVSTCCTYDVYDISNLLIIFVYFFPLVPLQCPCQE